ncbi:hypothetical protein EMIT0111MI5_70153 [Burkholderia sp. IT-111MI5]
MPTYRRTGRGEPHREHSPPDFSGRDTIAPELQEYSSPCGVRGECSVSGGYQASRSC